MARHFRNRPGTVCRYAARRTCRTQATDGAYVPADTRAVNERATEALRNSGITERALKVNEQAPAFTLPDHNGKSTSSAELLAKGPLVIAFLRGRWCPFCCGEAEALNRMLPEFEHAGGSLVAISPQSVNQAYFMHDQHELRFPLLVDEGNKVPGNSGSCIASPTTRRSCSPACSSIFRTLMGIRAGSCHCPRPM